MRRQVEQSTDGILKKMAENHLLSKSGSFMDQVALKKKTDKMFGLDQQDVSLRPQKEGWLVKKPFRTGGGPFASAKMARKRWFAVKDSFIFWWDTETKSDVGFDSHPKGAIPLGGATISLLSDKLTMELKHPVFTGNDTLTMKAADQFEASEWMAVIHAGMKATWENAILGFALIEKLKAKGSELENEKEEALLRAQKEAERLEAEREEAQRLNDMKDAQIQIHEAEVARVDVTVGALQKQVSIKEMDYSAEKEQYELEKKKREKLEKELQDAQDALYELEAAFEAFEIHRIKILTTKKLNEDEVIRKRAPSMLPATEAEKAAIAKAVEDAVKISADSKFKDEEMVRKNFLALRDYFEASARSHELRRQAMTSKRSTKSIE